MLTSYSRSIDGSLDEKWCRIREHLADGEIIKHEPFFGDQTVISHRILDFLKAHPKAKYTVEQLHRPPVEPEPIPSTPKRADKKVRTKAL